MTSTLVFEGQGSVGDYVGGYEDWLRQRKPPTPAANIDKQKSSPAKQAKPPSEKGAKQKLGYKEQRELAALPEKIEALEAEQQTLETLVSQPDFYQQDKDEIKKTLERLEAIRAELETAFARWEYLDSF